jgi:hypothetical protein
LPGAVPLPAVLFAGAISPSDGDAGVPPSAEHPAFASRAHPKMSVRLMSCPGFTGHGARQTRDVGSGGRTILDAAPGLAGVERVDRVHLAGN